jgi:hypothetical protein
MLKTKESSAPARYDSVVNPGELSRRLAAGNIWWSDPEGWAGKDRDLRRLRERALPYAPQPLSDLADSGLYVLYGARRVGKSVVVKRRIEQLVATASSRGGSCTSPATSSAAGTSSAWSPWRGTC